MTENNNFKPLSTCRSWLIAALLACLFFSASHSQAKNSINNINIAEDGFELQSFYLLDNNFTFEDVLEKQSDSNWQAYNDFKSKPWTDWVWQKVEINNTSSNVTSAVLTLDRSFSVPTRLFHLENDEWKQINLGDFDNYYHINFIYPSFQVNLQPGANFFYFHYIASKENPKAQLYSNKGFAETGFIKIAIMIFVLGMVALMAIYNLVIFVIEREREYAYYLLYLGSAFAITVELGGIERFVTQSAHLHYGSNLVALSPMFMSLFYLSMFDWKTKQKWVYYQVWAVIYISAAYTVFACFAPNELLFRVYDYYLPVLFYICFLGIYALLAETLNGSKQALIMLAGLLALVSGTFLSLGALFGIFPEIFVYASVFSYAAEMTLFSFALSVRKQEQLLTEVNAKKHSYGQLEKVFYPHQLEQMRSGKILEETMPEGEADAAVIAFDVAGSSQIKSPHVKDFLHNVMKACEMEMVRHYNIEEMSSDAYRVKEMGDGFLCSVGFPFKSAHPVNACQGAWELCLRFLEAFHQVEKEFAYDEPLYCGMGIAIDKIEAYFPSSGARQYDLYGRSIVLATRYESYRKMLFEQIDEHGSVIIVQEKLYQMLSPEQQDQLREFDLEASRYKIRDDFGAKRLYYKVFDFNQET